MNAIRNMFKKQNKSRILKPLSLPNAVESLPFRERVPFDFERYVDDYDMLAKESLATYSSNMQGGKVRILEFFKSNDTRKERVAFLKKEFGISGNSTVYGFVNYNNTGMLMNIRNSDKDIHIPWIKVADIIGELIEERSYFNPLLEVTN